MIGSAADNGIEYKDQYGSDDQGNAHIPGRMNTEIHSGKRGHQNENNAQDPQPGLPVPAGYAAQGACNILRMPGGKGKTAGILFGALHYGEVGTDPGPWNSAQQLEKLIENGAEKADKQKIISLPLIHTPENHQCKDDEKQLAAKQGEKFHYLIQKRIADGLQPEKKRHGPTSLKLSAFQYNTTDVL